MSSLVFFMARVTQRNLASGESHFRRPAFRGFDRQRRVHERRIGLLHAAVHVDPDQLPQAAFEAEHGSRKGLEGLRACGLCRFNAPEKFFIAAQVESQILFQPEYVADQGGATLLAVGSLGYPEQQRDATDEQQEGEAWQEPQPTQTAGLFGIVV